MLSPRPKVSGSAQIIRLNNLEQRIKEKKNRASSIKYQQQVLAGSHKHNAQSSMTCFYSSKASPNVLPNIQHTSMLLPTSSHKMLKAVSQRQQQQVEALRGILQNAVPENGSAPAQVQQHESHEPPQAVVSRNEATESMNAIATLKSLSNKAIIVDNRFEITKKIDEGTYAKVYMANDWHQNGKEVVIKILRQRAYQKPKDQAQIKKEIDNHSRLNHKNVIRLQGYGYKAPMHIKGVLDVDRTYVYLTTEFLGAGYINFYDLIKNSTV